MKDNYFTSRMLICAWNPFAMLCFGLLIGFISRLLDIFTTNLGEIFSQMAIWILLGTLISIYSKTVALRRFRKGDEYGVVRLEK